jgi:hypothetical protein
VIGSSNMTMGGLLSSVEASVVLTGDSSDPWPTNLLFDQLTPTPPFTLDHVRRVTDDLLTEIAPRLVPGDDHQNWDERGGGRMAGAWRAHGGRMVVTIRAASDTAPAGVVLYMWGCLFLDRVS